MASVKTVTPEEFVEAWRTVWCTAWEEVTSSNEKTADLLKVFESNQPKAWSDFMLNNDDAFLKRVAERLGFTSNRKKNEIESGKRYLLEYYNRTDMVLLDASQSHPNPDFPLLFEAAIEHENNPMTVKDELWKLAFLRAPLKVLVFYGGSPCAKIREMEDMLSIANAAFPENESTNYLFIHGRLSSDYPDEKPVRIVWRPYSFRPDGSRP